MSTRFRSKHGKVELPNNLDTKINMLMNILDVGAQAAITFVLDKSVDVCIESLKKMEDELNPEFKKIFSSFLKQTYQIKKHNGKVTVKKMRTK